MHVGRVREQLPRYVCTLLGCRIEMPSLFGPSEGPWWRTQVDLLAVLFLDFLLLVFIEWIGPQQKSGPAALAAGPIQIRSGASCSSVRRGGRKGVCATMQNKYMPRRYVVSKKRKSIVELRWDS